MRLRRRPILLNHWVNQELAASGKPNWAAPQALFLLRAEWVHLNLHLPVEVIVMIGVCN